MCLLLQGAHSKFGISQTKCDKYFDDNMNAICNNMGWLREAACHVGITPMNESTSSNLYLNNSMISQVAIIYITQYTKSIHQH